MSLLLLPEIARENASVNRRIALSVGKALQRLEEAGEQVENHNSQRQRMIQDAREATRYTLAQAVEARDMWQSTLELFKGGLEGGELREVLKAVLEVFDSWLGLAKTTSALWHSACDADGREDGLKDLTFAEGMVTDLATEANRFHAFLTRNRQPVDSTVLDMRRQAVARGDFKTPEQMRSRLQS